MIELKHLVALAQVMNLHKRSDLPQLLDGVQLDGLIVMGGGAQAIEQAKTAMMRGGNLRQVTKLRSLQDIQPDDLDARVTYSFDLMAIVQLLMFQQNQNFHGVMDTVINNLESMANDPAMNLTTAVEVFSAMKNQVGKL